MISFSFNQYFIKPIESFIQPLACQCTSTLNLPWFMCKDLINTNSLDDLDDWHSSSTVLFVGINKERYLIEMVMVS